MKHQSEPCICCDVANKVIIFIIPTLSRLGFRSVIFYAQNLFCWTRPPFITIKIELSYRRNGVKKERVLDHRSTDDSNRPSTAFAFCFFANADWSHQRAIGVDNQKRSLRNPGQWGLKIAYAGFDSRFMRRWSDHLSQLVPHSQCGRARQRWEQSLSGGYIT